MPRAHDLDSASKAFLEWPFLDASHRETASLAETVAQNQIIDSSNVDEACRKWVNVLGTSGLLRYCVPAMWGGINESLDSRSLCVIRDTLARHSGLADFAFAMQGIGSGPIVLGGSDSVKRDWLPGVAQGSLIAAFALTEPEAGSDAAALVTSAKQDGGKWYIDGCKTWISNGGIADFYCVFARTDCSVRGSKGVSAFLVPASSKGLTIKERLHVLSPHPLATVEFDSCEVPANMMLGQEGEGFKLAMQTLDIYRMTVAAAAVGLARRAMAATLRHANERSMFGDRLAGQPLAQAIVGDMAAELDAAALLTYRAAWQRDTSQSRSTLVSAIAKLSATEIAQKIIDRSVQLHGAKGVQLGSVTEQLYRDIRALRIYEGATEVQRILIGRETLKNEAVLSGDSIV